MSDIMTIDKPTFRGVSSTENLVSIINQVIATPNIDLDRLERFMAMHEKLVAAEKNEHFDEALAAAQADMKKVVTNRDNKQTGSKYATLGAIDDKIRDAYTSKGFALTFDMGECPLPEYVRLFGFLKNFGLTRTYHIDMPADGKGAKGGDVMTKTHATGSAVTYGRRYLTQMIFNVATGTADDDGNAASAKVALVTADQAKIIREKMTASETADEVFCNWARIDQIEFLPAARFDQVIKSFDTKIQKLAEAKAKAAQAEKEFN